MAEYSYLKPKVKAGNIQERKKDRGLFVNVPPFMKYAGLGGGDRIPAKEVPFEVEKGPRAESGKPI